MLRDLLGVGSGTGTAADDNDNDDSSDSEDEINLSKEQLEQMENADLDDGENETKEPIRTKNEMKPEQLPPPEPFVIE
jgi:hypothetical protein